MCRRNPVSYIHNMNSVFATKFAANAFRLYWSYGRMSHRWLGWRHWRLHTAFPLRPWRRLTTVCSPSPPLPLWERLPTICSVLSTPPTLLWRLLSHSLCLSTTPLGDASHFLLCSGESSHSLLFPLHPLCGGFPLSALCPSTLPLGYQESLSICLIYVMMYLYLTILSVCQTILYSKCLWSAYKQNIGDRWQHQTGGRSGNAVDFYSVGTVFESRPGHQQFWGISWFSSVPPGLW
jgi:hypothetical protein